ncbi:hypothetical protein [Oceanobacillus senegalensis]|uniref:hypothetical protein n=1 Tax=Oceanobacillus senegalensis TaxID=1936063 RepID=UPI000A312D4C|nr:hypothetical protein [Oceanobacillus senegalensis]
MVYKHFLILVILMLISPFSVYGMKEEAVLINTYQADVTGDGILDEINLKGIPFSKGAEYFHNIWVEVKSKGHEDGRWKISYGDGYEPAIQFVDINHDNVQDMLYQSPTGGSGGLYHYDLHTLANGDLLEIPLPKQEYISGKFADGFKIKIQFTPNEKPIEVDVKNRSKEYIRQGIYNKKGKLKKAKSLIIDPIAFFEPVKLTERKGNGLKSYKQVSGAYHADQLGTIEAIWYYIDGEWIILKSEWKEETP